MWTVAELLLGFVVLASLLGFHVGPHSHLAAGVVGVLAAGWLLLMAATGHAEPLLWVAFGADVVVTAGVGTAAFKGIETQKVADYLRLSGHIIGDEGVAISDLDPEGIVRVNSETWSATSLNGKITKGAKVQVVEAKGVRLGVWGEEAGSQPSPLSPFQLDQRVTTGEEPDDRRTGTT